MIPKKTDLFVYFSDWDLLIKKKKMQIDKNLFVKEA